jgi:hypothetical protein
MSNITSTVIKHVITMVIIYYVVDWLTPRLVLIAIIIFVIFICGGENSKSESMSNSISITQGS